MSCSCRFTPIMTLVTAGRARSQASAIWLTDTARVCAITRISATHSQARPRSTGGKSKVLRHDGERAQLRLSGHPVLPVAAAKGFKQGK
ncbi:hypothetical protein ACI093_003462 [Cronobacter turicensis]